MLVGNQRKENRSKHLTNTNLLVQCLMANWRAEEEEDEIGKKMPPVKTWEAAENCPATCTNSNTINNKQWHGINIYRERI